MENNPEYNIYQTPGSEVADPLEVKPKLALVCFGASTPKFLALYFSSLGFYGLYWFYKNWQLIGDRERYPVSPLLRTFFSVIWAYSCFSNINRLAQGYGLRVFPASILTIVYVASLVAGRLPELFWLLSFIGCLAFLPVNRVAEEINKRDVPGYTGNSRFSIWNWLLVVFGMLFLVLAILGNVYGE